MLDYILKNHFNSKSEKHGSLAKIIALLKKKKAKAYSSVQYEIEFFSKNKDLLKKN